MPSVQELMNILPQAGTVTWIGVRSAHRAPMQTLEAVEAIIGGGLRGDHYAGDYDDTRGVTLIQDEHLFAVASLLGREAVDPSVIRRNIVVKGINLLALKDKRFRIGEAVLEMTGECHPCGRMEENLGSGGFNAMRGHGGINARVMKNGWIRLGDFLIPV